MHLAAVRPMIEDELSDTDENNLRGLHRRFKVLAGAQAQVHWGEEGDALAHVGLAKTLSFHMTPSYSRDPFTCFTSCMDLPIFWDCHRRAFAHFGGSPAASSTSARRRSSSGTSHRARPWRCTPQAAACAEHYGFVIDPLAAYRPTGKGRVERQVLIVRQHILLGAPSIPSPSSTGRSLLPDPSQLPVGDQIRQRGQRRERVARSGLRER